MASFDTFGLQDVISQMQRMGAMSSPIAEEMVTAGAEEIRESWKRTADKYGLVDTGSMRDSVDLGPGPIKTGGVFYREVYPMGTDSKGVRNAEKAFILHYGKSNFHGTYWVDDAITTCEEDVDRKLTEIWDRFLKESG